MMSLVTVWELIQLLGLVGCTMHVLLQVIYKIVRVSSERYFVMKEILPSKKFALVVVYIKSKKKKN